MKKSIASKLYLLILHTGRSAGRIAVRALFGAVFFGSITAQAIAQDKSASDINPSVISDRLERLERDIQTINRQLSQMPVSGAAATANSQSSSSETNVGESDLPKGSLERILVRLSKLEDEIRTATDAMERSNHRFDLIEKRLESISGDTDFRLSRLENGNAGAPQRLNAAPGPASVNQVGPDGGQAITPITGYNAKPSGQAGVLGTISKEKLDSFTGNAADQNGAQAQDGATGVGANTESGETAVALAPATPIAPTLIHLPEGSVDDQYKHSFNLLRRAKYTEAEAAWKEFIAIHPDDQLVENARYWLGETYYVQKRFLDSAQAFLQSYQKAPEGSKAADSLLKLGKSMSNMDKKDEACAAYSKLRKEFSAISPNVLKTLERETKELGCK
ncbi:MAG: tol-pal system protein YbgF [Rhodospirillaceae bacterium]|nr:tol-pal system protein YbgF [Rhodospirillaceae bacterium]